MTYIHNNIYIFTYLVSTAIDFKINIFIMNRVFKEHVFLDIFVVRLMVDV